jgi:hypothetical protein
MDGLVWWRSDFGFFRTVQDEYHVRLIFRIWDWDWDREGVLRGGGLMHNVKINDK